MAAQGFGRLTGMDIAEARPLWDALPGWLNTASYGLPPRTAWDELQAVLGDWRVGRTSWEPWDEPTQLARASFARLVGVDPADVTVGSQVSQLLAPVAAAVPANSQVLVADQDFSSIVFPWLVHADRGIRVDVAPVRHLLDAIRPNTAVIAFSLVQSATGEIAPYAEIAAAGRAAGALVVVDATQACGWLPFDAGLADVVLVGAYKWLMSPRGTAFAYLAPAVQERTRPLAAGWYAAEDPHASYYAPPMELAKSARRFDTSPSWFNWVGTAPALEVVEQIGIAQIQAHNVALANRFLRGLDQPTGASAIVTVEVPGAEQKLEAAGVRAAVRAGRVRASFHVYSTERDVDLALDALAG
jgi:selenocysteine lyase/cysteine desulfurase